MLLKIIVFVVESFVLSDSFVVKVIVVLFDIEFLVIGMVIFDDVFLNLGNVYNERNGYFIVYVVGIY